MSAQSPAAGRWPVERLIEVRDSQVLAQHASDLGGFEHGFAQHDALDHLARAHTVMERSRELGRRAVEAGYGDDSPDGQLAGLKALEQAGADILSLAAGYPIVSQDVAGVAEIATALGRPCGLRIASSDARLAVEVALAGGVTYVATSVFRALAHDDAATPESIVEHHQYVDRLIAHFEEQGHPVVREVAAPGPVVPPCLAIALVLLEARLAADQGVRRLVLSYGLLGNVVQDAAALQVLREMATEELNADGGIDLYVGAAEWSGQVPDDEGARYGVVLNGAIAAGLGGADIMSTAPVGTPRSADAAAGAQTTRQLLDLLTGQQLETSDELGREADLTRRSARAILDAVADAGDGDLARGTALAVRRGILDLPFGGNRHLAGVARAVRDGDGRLRWLEPGGVPIPADARDLHAAAAANAAELPPTELVSAGFFVPPGHSPEAGGGVTT